MNDGNPQAPSRVRMDVMPGDRRAALRDATASALRGSPKELPAVWLYDERGSQLFEQITQLPEYYPTRREASILDRHSTEIASLTGARTLAELGSGTSQKTRVLLDELTRAGTLERFVALDVSADTLAASVESIADAYPGISVHGIVGDFENDLHALPSGAERLVAFLGSTIGNLDHRRRERFLTVLGSILTHDDAFLLGLDLVKERPRIERAYNDDAGITEMFVRNALDVASRELGAPFDQNRFAYHAVWDPQHEWMEIGVRALVAHTVPVAMLGFELHFDAGELLRVEVSSKFRRERIEEELRRSGLSLQRWWTDDDRDFALALVRPAPLDEFPGDGRLDPNDPLVGPSRFELAYRPSASARPAHPRTGSS